MNADPHYTLHNYFRSSTSIRVRVALNLKGLDYKYVPYALLPNAHKNPEYLQRNPEGLVPSLEITNGPTLSQSMAIIEYLNEVHPEPSLLPRDAIERARVRALAQIIGCDIHPVNNLRILRYIETQFGADKTAKSDWFRHWAGEGFRAIETRLSRDSETGIFCHGDTPSLADICLYAQVLNNRRFDVDPTPYPTIMRIFNACDANEAFTAARPENQPDAV